MSRFDIAYPITENTADQIQLSASKQTVFESNHLQAIALAPKH